MADYNAQAANQYNPVYAAKKAALQAQLAQSIAAKQGQKTGVNASYDQQVIGQNLSNKVGKNNLSNSANGRGFGNGTIVTTGLAEQDQINGRRVGQINSARTGDLSNIDGDIAALQTGVAGQISSLDSEKASLIADLARQLGIDDRNFNFQQQQANNDNAYKQASLALQRESINRSNGPSYSEQLAREKWEYEKANSGVSANAAETITDMDSNIMNSSMSYDDKLSALSQINKSYGSVNNKDYKQIANHAQQLSSQIQQQLNYMKTAPGGGYNRAEAREDSMPTSKVPSGWQNFSNWIANR